MDNEFEQLMANYTTAENHYAEILAEKEIISYIRADLGVGVTTARLIWS